LPQRGGGGGGERNKRKFLEIAQFSSKPKASIVRGEETKTESREREIEIVRK